MKGLSRGLTHPILYRFRTYHLRYTRNDRTDTVTMRGRLQGAEPDARAARSARCGGSEHLQRHAEVEGAQRGSLHVSSIYHLRSTPANSDSLSNLQNHCQGSKRWPRLGWRGQFAWFCFRGSAGAAQKRRALFPGGTAGRECLHQVDGHSQRSRLWRGT